MTKYTVITLSKSAHQEIMKKLSGGREIETPIGTLYDMSNIALAPNDYAGGSVMWSFDASQPIPEAKDW